MKKINNNKNLIFLYLITLVVLAVINFVVFNYGVLINSDNKQHVISIANGDFKLKNIKVEGDKLIPTKKNASIEIKVNRYIKYFNFNYDANKSFVVKEIINVQKEKGCRYKKNKSDSVAYKGIHIYSKYIDKNVKSIKLKFYGQDLKTNDIKISHIYIDNKLTFNYYTYLFFAIAFLVGYLLFFKRNYFVKHIEKGFLLISLGIGLLLMIAVPPVLNVVFDDQVHFYRVIDIAKRNNYFSQTEYNYINHGIQHFMIDTDIERKEVIKEVNKSHKTLIYDESRSISLYTPYNLLEYIPWAMLYKILDSLGIDFVINFMIGRLLTLLMYSLVLYFAIKIIPVYKHLFTLIALLPTTIYNSIQYNYDNFVFPFVMLFIAIFIYEMYHKKEKINKKLIIVMLLSLIIFSFTKAVYAPIGLLVLLYPKEKFYSRKYQRITKFGITFLIIILLSTFILPTVSNPSIGGDRRIVDTSVSGQISFILNNPISFIKIFISNYFSYFLVKFLGRTTLTNFSYYSLVKSTNVYYLLLAGLSFFTISSKKEVLTFKDKIFTLLIILITVSFIWGALYLSFTKVGSYVIAGVQGRYFIPLLFLLFISIRTNKINVSLDNNKKTYLLYGLSFFILFYSVYINIIQGWCL